MIQRQRLWTMSDIADALGMRQPSVKYYVKIGVVEPPPWTAGRAKVWPQAEALKVIAAIRAYRASDDYRRGCGWPRGKPRKKRVPEEAQAVDKRDD